MSMTDTQRRAIADRLEALCQHPTALADTATYRDALEMSLEIWPAYAMDRDIRLAAVAASARVRRAAA